MEASSTIDRIASMLPDHEIGVANPMKAGLIAESMKKTDRNDTHILLDLYNKSYMPESYLHPADIRKQGTSAVIVTFS